ncbi:MAG: outer membrane beta-barrel family protein [Lachnospiraceae bacterium]|nr:outer membrane beta-barrel family protein [Lachnospiraceae bacterium]
MVESKRGWIEKDRIVYIPSKNEKKLSNSPETLIESMHLPMLKIKSGHIVSISDQIVKIFIDGIEADQATLASFWPKDVLRVEYIENPTDPKFSGATKAVNFIMRKYEVGGNTKIDYLHRIPNTNRGEISSLFSYKHLTLGAMFSGGYSNDHRDIQETTITYSDFFYGGTHYDELTNSVKRPTHNIWNFMEAAISSKLKWDKFIATHNVSCEWSDKSESSNGLNSWSPMIFNSESSFSQDKSHEILVSADGSYYYEWDSRWSIAFGWWYSHSHLSGYSLSQTSDLPQIEDSYSEDANLVKGKFLSTFRYSPNLIFQVGAVSAGTWYKTRYGGFTESIIPLTRCENSGYILCFWQPFNTLSTNIRPGIYSIANTTDDVSSSTITPTVSGVMTWSPSNKFKIAGYGNFSSSSASASQYSPVVRRISELLWTQGNPYLKSTSYWSGGLDVYYLTSNRFSVSGYLGYDKIINPCITTYSAASEDMGGLIMTRVNTSPQEYFTLRPNFRLNMIGHRFNININPDYTHWISNPRGSRLHCNTWSVNASIDYTLKNCRFKLDYSSPAKYQTGGGAGITKTQNVLNFSFTWGNGNLYLVARVDNLFNKKSKIITDEILGNVISNEISRKTGRSVMVDLTYTFGYGKKVEENLNIGISERIESAILK